MKLIHALRVDLHSRVAFVGGGGKTTAMFQLARQFGTSVLVASTTHLGVEQAALADVHYAVGEADTLPNLTASLARNRVILVTGLPHEDGRLGAVPPDCLEELHEFAEREGLPLLVEADGSRRLPIKAPGTNEPVIPIWVNTVVVVAGLSSLGKPAGDHVIHRFAQFARITGIENGESISVPHIEKMLISQEGGLKGVPPSAKKIVLLNQADDEDLVQQAISLAKRLSRTYDAVLVASLKPPVESRSEGRVTYVSEKIAGIVLAAGGARRYGKAKSLLLWKEEPLIRHVVRTALGAGLAPVVVVVGATIQPIEEALSGLPVSFAENAAWRTGQSSSMRIGIQEIQKHLVGGALILQADQPLVPVHLVRQAIDLHAGNLLSNVVPWVDQHPSSPVLFDRAYFPALLEVQGDQGGRALFAKYPFVRLAWDKKTDLMDIDTPEDYQRLLRMDDGVESDGDGPETISRSNEI